MWKHSLWISILSFATFVRAGAGTYKGADVTGPQTIQNATNIPVSQSAIWVGLGSLYRHRY
jgi:hypothetical protein